jgi:hypothetical protein
MRGGKETRKGLRTREVYDVASPLDHRKLKSKTNTKKRSILLACPFDRQYQTLDAAFTKPAWDEDTAGGEYEDTYPVITGKKTLYFAPTTVRHAS